MSPSPSRASRFNTPSRISDLYRGTVEYNLDPLGIGRCKVRVPALHLSEHSVETDVLPWATPAMVGGMHHTGSFIVPEVGATVWVLHEGGDPQYPVYFGGWLKNPVQRREIHTKTSPVDLAVYPKTGNPSGGTWRQPSGPEAHPEVLSSPDFDPTTKVVYRSPKGATVLVEERDEGEAVRILDRTGQELSFLSPVTEADNEGSVIQIGATPTEWSGTTGLRRDQKAVSDGDEIPVDNTVGKTTRVRLLGTGGQGIEILATPSGNRVEVISQDSETQDEARIRLGSGQGIIEILGSAEGEETFRLLVNTRTGDVRLVAGAALRLIVPTLSIEAERIAIDGETRLNGSLTISDDLLVGGKVVGGG